MKEDVTSVSDRPERQNLPEYRAIHTSDVHLGAYDRTSGDRRDRSNHAFTRVVDVAMETEADLLLIAGDFFDNHFVSPETVAFAMDEVTRFGKPVLILPGNHDHVGGSSIYEPRAGSELPSNLQVFRDPAGGHLRPGALDLQVWGRPHAGGRCSPLTAPPPRGEARWQVAMAHGHYVAEGATSGASYQVSAADLANCDRDYVAFGHWDNMTRLPNAGPVAAYSGSPTTHDGGLAEVLMVDFLASGRVALSARHLGTGAVRAHHDLPQAVYQ